jgi:hypothetical protein
MSKYYYNKDYFETIDTQEKAYWLGFLYADGCINRMYKNEKLKGMTLELTICKEDKTHLVKFLNSIESNVEIKNKTTTLNGKVFKSNRVIICCTKMCYDLIDKGCTPQKSLILTFPNLQTIPKHLVRHFIRGYFDGDGCLYANTKRISLSIVGTSDMLNGISDFLLSESILRTKQKYYNAGNAAQMYIYGNDNIKEVLDYLYQDATIYLGRKYNKFCEHYKNYDDINDKRGSYFDAQNQRWKATISINNKRIYLGSFKSAEEAIDVRKKAEINKIINADLNQ